MVDFNALLAAMALTIGPAGLAWAVAHRYYTARTTPYRTVLERIVTSANDPDARGLEDALTDADTLLGRTQ